MFTTLYPLQIEKSIRKSRLVYKITFAYIFDLIFMLFACAVVLFMMFVFSLNATRNLSDNVSHGIILIILLLVTLWLFTNMYFTNVSVKVKCESIADNKIKLHTLITNIFEKLNKTTDSDNLIIYYYTPKYLGFSKLSTCIYHDNDIYLNISTLGRGDGPLPFFGLYNYFRAKRLLKSINQT